MIQSHIIYNQETGRICKEFTGTSENLSANIHEGQASIAGVIQGQAKYIIDGEQVSEEYSTEQLVEKVAYQIRERRDYILYRSDWTQVVDAPLAESKKTEWAAYRQALRDLPNQYTTETDITNVVYPTPPEA